jgi:hypothetical protein
MMCVKKLNRIRIVNAYIGNCRRSVWQRNNALTRSSNWALVPLELDILVTLVPRDPWSTHSGESS